jgi:hypothetical protein
MSRIPATFRSSGNGPTRTRSGLNLSMANMKTIDGFGFTDCGVRDRFDRPTWQRMARTMRDGRATDCEFSKKMRGTRTDHVARRHSYCMGGRL